MSKITFNLDSISIVIYRIDLGPMLTLSSIKVVHIRDNAYHLDGVDDYIKSIVSSSDIKLYSMLDTVMGRDSPHERVGSAIDFIVDSDLALVSKGLKKGVKKLGLRGWLEAYVEELKSLCHHCGKKGKDCHCINIVSPNGDEVATDSSSLIRLTLNDLATRATAKHSLDDDEDSREDWCDRNNCHETECEYCDDCDRACCDCICDASWCPIHNCANSVCERMMRSCQN